MFAAMKPSDFGTLRLIDVTAEPLGVLEDIAQCDLVVSSSLHGIIAADALGIENIWARFTDLREDAFKFEDYFTGVGAFVPKQADLREDINPDVFQQHARLTPAPDLDKARERMLDAFPFPEKLQLTEPWKTQREIG